MSASRGRGFLGDFKRTARQFARSKIGVIGLAVIVFYVCLAVFSAQLAPIPPLDHQVAAQFDVPAWATIFPQYRGVAIDQTPVASGFGTQQDVSAWNITGTNLTSSISPAVSPSSPTYTGSVLINSSLPANLTASDPYLPNAVVLFSMSQSFKFSGAPPPHFDLTTSVEPIQMQNISRIYLNFIIYNPSGGNYSLSSTTSTTLASTIEIVRTGLGQWDPVDLPSGLLAASGIPAYAEAAYPSEIIINQTGTYQFVMQVMGIPAARATTGTVSMYINSVNLHLSGGAYGILGTDNLGNDVWSQLVWGSRISMMVGIAAGLGSVLIGALAGIAAGYVGGLFSDVLERVTDFFLVLPFLPLLIIITSIIAANPILIQTVYVWIILIFVILSWPFIAILIRAQTVSIKERQYVEASRALGGGTGHVLRKHILPNVMGLVYSQVALNVSGFILLDAALDFLSIANHGRPVISWGIMLSNALPFATGAPLQSYVWWWFLPPGISIALLSLAFVLVGYALDAIFNPRLRAR